MGFFFNADMDNILCWMYILLDFVFIYKSLDYHQIASKEKKVVLWHGGVMIQKIIQTDWIVFNTDI